MHKNDAPKENAIWTRIRSKYRTHTYKVMCYTGGFALPAALAAVLVAIAEAHPSYVSCAMPITEGKMMMKTVERLSSTQVQLAKDGNTVACGGTLRAGDAGLTFVKASGVGRKYKIEAIASAGMGEWGIIAGECTRQRTADISDTYTVPPSGTVTLRIAHAKGYGQVSTSADCTYSVKAGITYSFQAGGGNITATGTTGSKTSAGGNARALHESQLARLFVVLLVLAASARSWLV